ncbi:MAG: cbb3-type cytochrome c oxidase subunit 3 [Hyphomicrobiales bacterium]|nr:MAG: cbb3-type cytochrome c oxidase subunit 3 [Hyphomicrobiales bacterium]
MQTTYHWLAGFAQSAGLLYFVAVFLGVCVYAFWPRNRARFEQAALNPLRED